MARFQIFKKGSRKKVSIYKNIVRTTSLKSISVGRVVQLRPGGPWYEIVDKDGPKTFIQKAVGARLSGKVYAVNSSFKPYDVM